MYVSMYESNEGGIHDEHFQNFKPVQVHGYGHIVFNGLRIVWRFRQYKICRVVPEK